MKIKTLITVLIFILFITSCGISEKTQNATDNIIQPTNVEKTVDLMEDNELISVFQNDLYPKCLIVQNWICNTSSTLLLDETVTFDTGDNRANYQLITNVSDKNELENNIEHIYSDQYVQDVINPILFEDELPLIIQTDDGLYYNANTGGALTYSPDFTRAKIISKNKEYYEIEVPITYVDDSEGETYTYKIIMQDDQLLLDNDYWFDLFNN